MIKSFRLPDLMVRYERVTPHLQLFLREVIGKQSPAVDSESTTHNPDTVCPLQNSEASETITEYFAGKNPYHFHATQSAERLMTYHPLINTLMLWDNRAPKRLIQAFNRYGFSVSYSFLLKAVVHLSKDAVHLAKSVANDRSKVKLFPYDNFNWMAR
jgi:hypothetical protein